VFGDLFDLKARQKILDEGPPAIAEFNSRRYSMFKTLLLDHMVSKWLSEQKQQGLQLMMTTTTQKKKKQSNIHEGFDSGVVLTNSLDVSALLLLLNDALEEFKESIMYNATVNPVTEKVRENNKHTPPPPPNCTYYILRDLLIPSTSLSLPYIRTHLKHTHSHMYRS
jgi:hypothetical protein